jgi:hypothetical protein
MFETCDPILLQSHFATIVLALSNLDYEMIIIRFGL